MLHKRMSKRKSVTELYANSMIEAQPGVCKPHSLTFDRFLLSPEHIKTSPLDMAKHVHSLRSFFARNNEKAEVKKRLKKKPKTFNRFFLLLFLNINASIWLTWPSVTFPC